MSETQDKKMERALTAYQLLLDMKKQGLIKGRSMKARSKAMLQKILVILEESF